MCELLSGFIVFEGLDGSGKSTQARLLEARLKAERDVILTAEPTDNPVGQLVRKVLRHQVKTTSTALALLYAADRSDHLFNPEYGIRRQLDEGKTVISDRYFYSSLAYQGVTEDFDWLKKINSYPYSEYIIFIDTDASSCIQRIEGRGEEKELFDRIEYLEKVRKNFIRVFENLPEGVKYLRVDGSLDIETQSEIIWDFISR